MIFGERMDIWVFQREGTACLQAKFAEELRLYSENYK